MLLNPHRQPGGVVALCGTHALHSGRLATPCSSPSTRPRLPAFSPAPSRSSPPSRPQATSNLPGNLSLVQRLVEHPAFTISNPNNCYSLFLGFGRSPVNFHAADGSGYAFMADAVLKVDGINHQVRIHPLRTHHGCADVCGNSNCCRLH